MNTQGIGNRDSWAQFVKLTQEARVRNKALTNPARGAATTKNVAAFSRTTLGPIGSRSQLSAGESKPETKILGRQFDVMHN